MSDAPFDKLVFCPICRDWLLRPEIAGYAVLYCLRCDGCVQHPRLWDQAQDSSTKGGLETGIMTESARTANVSAIPPTPPDPGRTAHELAASVEVPPYLPGIERLGAVQEVHRMQRPWKFGLAAILCLAGLGVVAAGLSMGWCTGRLSGRPVILILALAFLVPAFSYLFLRHLFFPFTVLVFQNGLIKIRGRRIDTFPWDNLIGYFEGVGDQNGNLSSGRIKNADGQVLDFNDLDTHSQSKLDELARREIWNRMYSTVANQIERGEIVYFGDLGISKTGLAQKGVALAWSEIKRIRVEWPDTLIVRRHGGYLHWVKKRIRRIPNYFILRHFIEQQIAIEHERGG